jgi:hypothetical protein
MELILHRIAGTKLFVNTVEADQPTRAVHASFCFLCPDASDLELELSFANSLKRRGAYAFTPASSTSPFKRLLPELAKAVQDNTQVLLWMDSAWDKVVNRFLIRNGVTVQTETVRCWEFDLLTEKVPGQGSIGFSLPAGAQATFDDSGIILTHTETRLISHVYTQVELMELENGRLRLEAASGAACATLQGSLSPALTSKLLSRLTPQVRYAWRSGVRLSWRAARILSAQDSDHVGVGARFQLHRYTPAHASSWIALESEDLAMAKLKSELVDTSGHAVEFKPDVGAAIYFQTSSKGNPHASIKGQFAVLPSPAASLPSVADAPRQILVGSSGTEFFELGKNRYDGLAFYPDGEALVSFGSGQADPTTSPDLRTAWIAPCRTTETPALLDDVGFSFVAQPQDQPLYGRRGVVRGAMQQVHASTVLFDPAPVEVAPSVAMPFFPLRGLRKTDLADTQKLDLEVLAPVRGLLAATSRAALMRVRDGIGALELTNALEWITTPQGLFVQVDENNQWREIKLGEGERWQLTIKRPTTDGQPNGTPVERWALQEAMSRPDVFVVVTKRVIQGMPPPENPPFGTLNLSVELNGWTIKTSLADMGSPGAPLPDPNKPPLPTDPVLIIKLSKGPLREMLGNVSRWQLPRLFNNDPATASQSAMGALERLEMLSLGDSPMVEGSVTNPSFKKIPTEVVSYYEALYDRIIKEDWTGVLVMNAENSLDDVPPQLAMLKEGVEGRKSFSVPILGIDISRVLPAAGGMTLKKTSAFAAVHHHAPEPLDEAAEGFEYKLRTFNAVFDNSELRTLRASMQLRLAEYFGAKASLKEKGDSRLLDILCCYEAKDAVNGKPEYVFRALGERQMSFEGNPLLKGLAVTRIDVTSDRTIEGSKTRFGFWGDLSFADKFANVTGIKKIAYENAALIMSNNVFEADIGNVRVEFDKNGKGNSKLDGLLAKFPLKLSDLRWSSWAPGKRSLQLPDLGYTGLKLPDLGDFKASSFDFGLELDLNLGSMGKLFEAVSFLQAKIIIGWYDQGNSSEGFALGFRFEGGNGPLDIGINGVLRLTARDVNLKSYQTPAGIGIGLLDPQLEVMGYKVPSDPKDTLVAFMPSNGGELGWAWARPDTDVGPLDLTYFAIGQRMELVPAGPVKQDATLNDIIDASVKLLRPSTDPNGVAKLPDVGKLYAPDSGWGVVARGSIGAFNVRFVFLDQLERYGLGLDIPNIAKVDVIYRKLSDNLGVFSAQIEPAFRTLEMGGATVTLPIVGFDAVTDGGWALNIGYHGNDFSRGTTVQVLPFLGSGGIRFGKLDWRSSYVLNGPHSTRGKLIEKLDLNPVVEMSLAARVGLGKEFREGVFQAGITLSVYGIFEGALGRPQDKQFPTDRPARYIKISGTVGLLLEIFGAVHFSLISASVSIRLWVEVGLTLETWAPVIFHAEAGVSVFVRFVIARFKIFGKRFEIAINFSFATRVRFTQKLPANFDGIVPKQYEQYLKGESLSSLLQELTNPVDVTPLNWVAHDFAAAIEVPAAVSIEPMMSGNMPVLLPMLLASDLPGRPAGLSEFTVRLFLWAFRLSDGKGPNDPTSAKISLKQLEILKERVSPPKGVSLARWGANPLSFIALQTFMETHLRIQLTSPQLLHKMQQAFLAKQNVAADVIANHQKPSGVLVPWFADIAIWADSGGAKSVLRDFRTSHIKRVDEAWEAALFALLSESKPEYEEEDIQALKREMLDQGKVKLATGEKDALDVIAEDWAAALVQGIVQQAIQEARRLGGPSTEKDPNHLIDLASLTKALLLAGDEGVLATQVVQHASTFLHHGLRIPSLGGAGSQALQEFLKSELQLAELNPMGECKLLFQSRPGFTGSWINGTAELTEIDAPLAEQKLMSAWDKLRANRIALELAIEDDDIDSTTQLRRFVPDVLVPFGKLESKSASLHMVAIPEALFALSQRRPNLKVTPWTESPKDRNDRKQCLARWYVRIAVQLEKPTRDGTHAVYAVRSVDPRIREIVRAMSSSGNENLVKRSLLAFHTSKKPDELIPFTYVEGNEAFFFVSNLSREPRPPRTLLAQETDQMPPTQASLANTGDVARILWMASTVNSSGFYLAFNGKNPIGHLFEDETVASVSLVLELSEQLGFPSVVDGLLVDSSDLLVDPAELEVRKRVALETNAKELSTNTPDGQVAITVKRANSLYGVDPDSDEYDAASLAARFELVDWRTPNGAVNLMGTAEMAMEREKVVPVRTYMEDDERQRAASTEDEPEIFPHRLTVPLSRVAHLTAMRFAANSGGPPPREEDPYAFVGTDVAKLVIVGLRDGAGHVLEDSRIKWSWAGTHKILYRDPIFTLQELPGARVAWKLTTVGGLPAVSVLLSWTNEKMLGLVKPGPLPERPLVALLAQYRRCHAMVRQADFTAKAQARIGNGKSVTVDAKSSLLDWLAAVIAFLEQNPLQKEWKVIDAKELSLTLLANILPIETPIPQSLNVELLLKRDEKLCDQRLFKTEETTELWEAVSPVTPANLEKPEDWDSWALDVKRTFGGAFSLLRHVDGFIEPSTIHKPATVVYLTRRAMLAVPTLKAMSASFFAPTPLAKSQLSGTVNVQGVDGTEVEVEIKDVDLNAVAARASVALEGLLTAGSAESLCRNHTKHYSTLTSAKRKIGSSMAGRLQTVLKSGTDVPDPAKEKFCNASRGDTSIAFAPLAVVSVNLEQPSPQGKTFLWGSIALDEPRTLAINAEPEPPIHYSHVSVPLGATGPAGSFDFIARWTNPGLAPQAVAKGDMGFRPKYVEVKGMKDPSGYVPSDWYEIVWSDELGASQDRVITVTPPSGEIWSIPLPLRMIPPTPSILRHDFLQPLPLSAVNLQDYLKKARDWTYRLYVLVPREDHDTAHLAVHFDDSANTKVLDANELFNALAAYTYHERTIAEVTGLLVTGGNPSDGTVKMIAELFERISTALAPEQKSIVAKLASESIRRVNMGVRRGNGITDITWKSDPDVKVTLFSIPTKDGDPELPFIPDSASDGMSRYKGSPAPFKGTAGLSPRRIELSALDIMIQSRAMPELMARRNEELLTGVVTNPEFVFETPSVRAYSPLAPHLVHASPFDIGTGEPTEKHVRHWLEILRDSLLAGVGSGQFAVDISARLKLPLVRDGKADVYMFPPLPSVKGVALSGSDWTSPYAGNLVTTLARLSQQARDEGWLELRVNVFSDNGVAERPVLTLDGLSLRLNKLSTQASLEDLFDAGKKLGSSTNAHVLAANYVYAQTRWLDNDDPLTYQVRKAIALFVLTRSQDLFTTAPPPASELATISGRKAWVASLSAAELAVAPHASVSGYALLAVAPAAPGATEPVPHLRHWGMTIAPERLRRVAGPLRLTSSAPDEAEELYLWGLE